MNKTSTPPKKNPVLRVLGCLIKVPLGCMGFMLGGVVVTVIFLPPSLGSLLHDRIERLFSRHFAGSLAFEEIWMGSLYNEQRVEGLVLRDPSGELVLSGALRAPNLWSAEFGDNEAWGPIELNLDQLNLVLDEAGSSNLERALARNPSREQANSERDPFKGLNYNGLNRDLPRTLTFELSIGTINWQRPGQPRQVFEDLVLALDIKREGWQRRMDGEGQVHLRGGSDKPISFRCHVDDLLEPRQAPWMLALRSEDVSLEMLSSLLGPLQGLADLLGPTADMVNLKCFGQDASERRVEALISDEGQRLDLRASWNQERRSLLASGKEQGASLAVPPNSSLARIVMRWAVPLGDRFEMGSDAESLRMHFREFELPLDGDLNRLQAKCTIEARNVSFAYLEGLQSALELDGRERLEEDLHLSLRNGFLLYDGLSLPAKATVLQLDGDYDLRDGKRRLVIQYRRFPKLNLGAGGQWQPSGE